MTAVDTRADLGQCDPEVFAKGTCVFVTHTISATQIEDWVRRVAAESGQRVDWHYVGGRACVKALGDLNAVRRCVRALRGAHDGFYRGAAMSYYLEDSAEERNQIERQLHGLWEFNEERLREVA